MEFLRIIQNVLCSFLVRVFGWNEAALVVGLELGRAEEGLDAGVEGDGAGGGEVEGAFGGDEGDGEALVGVGI